MIAAEPVERKFLKAVKSGEVAGLDYETQLADAENKGIIGPAERALLAHVRAATFEFISVDDFAPEELRAAVAKKPQKTLRNVA